MKKRLANRRLFEVVVSIALTFAVGAALADPPGRVARLAYVNGAVSYAVAGSNDWVQAGINRPLMPGDRLWVDSGGRDEVQIGSTALRMDGGTLVSVLSLDDRTAQFQLSQGRVLLRVRRLGTGDVLEVDTPNLALSIRRPGVYRLEVDPNGASTLVAVRGGQAEAYGEGNAYLIDAGQSYRFGGTNLQDYQYAQTPSDDDFERWAAQRDQRHDRALATRYVSPELVGYEDLDDHGSWHAVPGYGTVWTPAHVSSDWAPYRDGHWVWIEPWGWTWVDDAPWGFAVSHYGRWTHFDSGWSWVPGPPVERPVYAPALVAFVAGASLALVADRGPGVAWFPLGPREVYRPAYQASPAYVTNVNVTNTVINRTEINKVVNVTNVTNVNYANRQVPGAITAVPAQAFVRAQPVRRAALPVSRQVLAAATVTNKAAVAPQAESRVPHRPAPSAPAPVVVARQVIAHTPPPARNEASPRGVQRPVMAALAASAPPVKVLPPVKPGRPLAPPPPPVKTAVASAPRPEQQTAGAPPQAARPPVLAGHTQAARPPELVHRPEAARPPDLAQAPRSLPPHLAEPPAHVPPQGLPRHPPAQAHAEAAAPPPPSLRRDAPHQLAQAKPVAPPPPQARSEPAHSEPPRDVPHQFPPPRPMEQHLPQPSPAEAHRPPPEAHTPPPEAHQPPPARPAAEQHPAPAKGPEHRPAEKEKRKEE